MWKRKLLKDTARDVIRSNYWETVFAYVLLQIIIVIMFLVADALPLKLAPILIYVFGVAPMVVGYSKYALNNSEGRASVRDVFFPWWDHYGNILWCTFVSSLEVLAFSCLLIVPGIVKAYELRQVPFILAEDPSTDRKEAFRRSREMMNGEKYKAFLLDLSFLGWIALSVVTGGVVGIFWSNAYWHQTAAELYRALQEKLQQQEQLVEMGDCADEELGDYVELSDLSAEESEISESQAKTALEASKPGANSHSKVSGSEGKSESEASIVKPDSKETESESEVDSNSKETEQHSEVNQDSNVSEPESDVVSEPESEAKPEANQSESKSEESPQSEESDPEELASDVESADSVAGSRSAASVSESEASSDTSEGSSEVSSESSENCQ